MTAWRIRVRHGARLVTLTYGPAGRISREDDTLRRCRCVCFPRHDARVGPGLLQVPHVTDPPFPTSVNFTVTAGSLSPDLRWDSAVEELSGWPVAPVCPCSLPLSRSHFPLKDRVSLLVPLWAPPERAGGGHLLSQSKQTLSFEAEMAQDGSRLGRVFTAPSGGARLSQDFDHHGPPRSEMRPCI